ncbi:MAG: TIGR01212 family radical SAM protein [Desulfovibrio sp.]|nr:TIGR01212 family radical SAM protein [Desulfovibrio sp.]MBI4958618.1 TIGR01212 family radical SAM protein [Desulfovibrio sp.]
MKHDPLASAPSCGYNTVSARWRALFGKGSRKIPLDAGFTCPNRDGTISFGGCTFCNEQGSGTGFSSAMTLSQQWEHWRKLRQAKWGDVALIAYLQSFSNTHGPASILEGILGELSSLPDLSGLCLGTRPDCLDDQKLDLLAAFPTSELWLELGLQSSNPATLARVNRGHGPGCFARTVENAANRGIKVLAHVVAGLPGETLADWSATVDFVNRLPVAGIKFHNLYVATSTPLAEEFRAGGFSPLTLEAYAGWVADSLAKLRPDIVVHRIAADPAPGELVAPNWAGDKRLVLDSIADAISRGNVRQGMYWR